MSVKSVSLLKTIIPLLSTKLRGTSVSLFSSLTAKKLPTILLIKLFFSFGCHAPLQHGTHSSLGSYHVIKTKFKHLAVLEIEDPTKKTLVVFIEGDGTPWIDGMHIARDPTPKNPITLKLMSRYTGNKMFLGRPCYHSLNDSLCGPKWWTSHRYSPEVIESIKIAIKKVLQDFDIQRISLIGYSGGGVITSQLLCSFDIPTQVITLGTNLDTQSWTMHHNWSPLYGSLNPATVADSCQGNQVHFQGGRDKVVPLETTRHYFVSHSAKRIIISNADHHNWEKYWNEINAELISFQAEL